MHVCKELYRTGKDITATAQIFLKLPSTLRNAIIEQASVFCGDASRCKTVKMSGIREPGHRQHPDTDSTRTPTAPGHRQHPDTDSTRTPTTPGHRQHPDTDSTRTPTAPGQRQHPDTDSTRTPTAPGHRRQAIWEKTHTCSSAAELCDFFSILCAPNENVNHLHNIL